MAVEHRCSGRRGGNKGTWMLSDATAPPHTRRRFRGLYGVALFAALTAWTVFADPPAFGGAGNFTFTTSTSSHTVAGCPSRSFSPSCVQEGTTLTCVTTTTTFGPACIGIGNRDEANELPCNTSCCGSSACDVPPFGTPFCVQPGTTNINTNTDTTTFICTAAAPALGPWTLALCALLLAAFAVRRVNRRRGAALRADASVNCRIADLIAGGAARAASPPSLRWWPYGRSSPGRRRAIAS